jgi:predicted ATP-grasp superfamily ATP-dependent carboligase
LAKRFIEHGFDVYSYETDINCPISEVATVIEGKRWSEPDIRQHIVDTIGDVKPDLVLPLSDHATPILSSIPYKGVVTASGRTNAICLDKKKLEDKLKDREYYPNVVEGQSVILKPIFGANSKGLHRVSYDEYDNIRDCHLAEFGRILIRPEDYIAQRCIEGGFEISTDAYFNKYSKMIDAVPRKRDEVQGGEVSRSTTMPRDAHGVVEITKQLGEEIGLVGPVCAQYIIDSDGHPWIMEINSRFGGGVILSLEAGFDQIQLLIDEYVLGKPIMPHEHNWEVGFSMTRYFSEYFYGSGFDK